MLDLLLAETFLFFRDEADPATGLTPDKTQPHSPSSIAAVGLSLSAYIVAAERGLLSRADAVTYSLRVLRFLHSLHQGPQPDASGYQGFFYHFIDMRTGKRAWNCELSTIDTAILMGGVLTAAAYYGADSEDEHEIREIADALYLRVNWQWALDGQATICHGWNPESGFLPYRWDRQYSEAHILYVLALGSSTFPIDPGDTDNGFQPSGNRRSTATIIFTPDRCSFTRCHINGSTFAESMTTSIAKRDSITLKTAAVQPTFKDNTRLRIP